MSQDDPMPPPYSSTRDPDARFSLPGELQRRIAAVMDRATPEQQAVLRRAMTKDSRGKLSWEERDVVDALGAYDDIAESG